MHNVQCYCFILSFFMFEVKRLNHSGYAMPVTKLYMLQYYLKIAPKSTLNGRSLVAQYKGLGKRKET